MSVARWTAQSTGLITMGLVTPQGAVPTGKGVQVEAFPTQTTFLSTWADGSMRHGVVAYNAASTGAKDLSVIPNPGGTFTPTWPSASITLTERVNNALLRYAPNLSGVGTGGSTRYFYRSSVVSTGSHESFPSRLAANWLGLDWNATLSSSNKIRVQDAVPVGSTNYKVYGRSASSQLLLTTGTPSTPAVTSITASGRTATVTTGVAHNLLVGDRVTVSGCTQAAYNGVYTIETVPTGSTFTYSTPFLQAGPSSPATGSPVITYFIYFDDGSVTPSGAYKTSAVDDPGTVWTATLPAFDGTHTSSNGAIMRRAWVRVTPMNGGTPHSDVRVKFEVTSYAAGGHVVDCILYNIRNSTTVDQFQADLATTVAGAAVAKLTQTMFTIYVGQMWHGRKVTGFTEAVVLHDFEPWIAANVIPRFSPNVDPHTYDLTQPSYQLGGGSPTGSGGNWYFGNAEGYMQDSENDGRQELNPWVDWQARLCALNTEDYRLAVLADGDVNGGWSWQCSRTSDDEAMLKSTEDSNGTLVCTDTSAGIRKDSGLQWGESINTGFGGDGHWRGTFSGGGSSDSGTWVEREHLNENVFIPYLLTGDVFYLDLLRYQGGWVALSCANAVYTDSIWTGFSSGRNGNRLEQNGTGMHRGFGRPLQKIARAAWAIPDVYASDQTYLKNITQYNLEATAYYDDYLDSRGWNGGTWATFSGFDSRTETRSNVVLSTTGASPTVLTVVGDASGIGIGTNDHGMQTGDFVTLSGFSGGAAGLNGYRAIIRLTATTFSVVVNTTGSATSGVGTWSTRTAFNAPPWSISDAARVISWIGFTGLWTMTASMWAFPDRVARACIALSDNPAFDTHPGTSYQYNAKYGYVVADGYHFANSWTEFENINNHTDSDTAPLTNSESIYTGVGSTTHRGNALGWNDPGFNTFYTPYVNFMNTHAIRRGIAGAVAFQTRLQAASDVLPELKRRAGFFAIQDTPPGEVPPPHHSMNTTNNGAVC